VVTT